MTELDLADAGVSWVDAVDDGLIAEVLDVLAAVIERGGAIGWFEVPTPAVLADWLAGWCGRDDRRLAVCRVDGVVRAIGGWTSTPGPLGHLAELTKVMAAPGFRGHGLGRRVVDALLADARGRGFELAVLGVRGSNHPARRLYESAGFRIWGVLPRGVRVGEHRFDDVRMYRELVPAGTLGQRGVVDHGLAPTGPGQEVVDDR